MSFPPVGGTEGAEPPPRSPDTSDEYAGATGSAPPEPGQKVPRTKTGAAYNALIAGAIVLILLLVFILENTESVKIAYFGVGFHMPLGVALLLAAIAGALIVGIVGTARIVQLRRHARRGRH